MKHPYGANQYRQMAVTTASRGQLLLMLYEGAIKNIRTAQTCLDAKNIAGKGVAIGKAHDIINELINTLDFSIGGQIAIDLERLYNYMIDQLVLANCECTKEPLIVVQRLLETLLEGWRAAVVGANKRS